MRGLTALRRAAASALHHPHHPPPGVGPCRAMSVVSGEQEKISDKEVHALNKKIEDMDKQMEKTLMEQNKKTQMDMLQLKYDIRKDADDKYIKNCFDNAAARNELRLLQKKFETHKLAINHIRRQGVIIQFKNYLWGVGAGSALVARSATLSKSFSKLNGKE